jgi:hypothetical protein
MEEFVTLQVDPNSRARRLSDQGGFGACWYGPCVGVHQQQEAKTHYPTFLERGTDTICGSIVFHHAP